MLCLLYAPFSETGCFSFTSPFVLWAPRAATADDFVTIAPAQTLTDKVYQQLHDAAVSNIFLQAPFAMPLLTGPPCAVSPLPRR